MLFTRYFYATYVQCPSKGLSEKLSPARDIARARGAVKKRGKIERSFDLAKQQ